MRRFLRGDKENIRAKAATFFVRETRYSAGARFRFVEGKKFGEYAKNRPYEKRRICKDESAPTSIPAHERFKKGQKK